jgi:Family of unknown function (DUF5407)
MSTPTYFQGNGKQSGFNVQALFSIVNNATVSCKTKLTEIQGKRSSISIGDMFEMQMLMNHLSQLSEMSTAVVSSSSSAITSMARNVKG